MLSNKCNFIGLSDTPKECSNIIFSLLKLKYENMINVLPKINTSNWFVEKKHVYY